MKLALSTAFALLSASTGVYAHELRGAPVVLADIAAADEGFAMDGEEDKKNNAAQKRQNQRDQRRSRNNPDRSRREEERERDRKARQSRRSGRTDPYDEKKGNPDYEKNRENRRERNCEKNDRDCEKRWREADRDCFAGCRGVRSCERRCEDLDDVEDVEYIADFLNHEDVTFISDFLWDAFDEDDLDAFEEAYSADSNDH